MGYFTMTKPSLKYHFPSMPYEELVKLTQSGEFTMLGWKAQRTVRRILKQKKRLR